MPGFLTRNFRIKVLATIAALVTWTGVVYANNPPDSRSVRVHVPQDTTSIPGQFVLVQPIPDVVVTVSGTRDHVAAFDSSSIRASVNYAQISRPGSQQLPLQVTDSDPAVTLDNPPTTVTAQIDALGSASVQVVTVINPAPPAGYIVSAQTISPQSVTLTGPAQALRGAQALVTLDLSQQKTNLVVDSPVTVKDSTGITLHSVGVTPATVQVSLTLSTTVTSRSSAVVPKIVGELASGHTLDGVTVSPQTAVLTGPRDLLNALDAVSTVPVSLSGVNSDLTVTIALAPPPGVTAVPTTVTVTFHVSGPPSTPTPSSSPTPSTSATPGPT